MEDSTYEIYLQEVGWRADNNRQMWPTRFIRLLADSLVIILIGAVAAGALVRFSPGSDVDLREADPRFSSESLEALRQQREEQRRLTGRSLAYFRAWLSGDFGVSETRGVPVRDLLAERLPVTLRTVGFGAAAGFLAGTAAAAGLTLLVRRTPHRLTAGAFALLLSIPSGVLALFAVFSRTPVEIAVALAVAPRIFFFADQLLGPRKSAWWALVAHSSGIHPVRVLLVHLLPSIWPELAALGGLAVISALAVSIPAEVLSGNPGIGQLAWQSATERDVPVVIAVTVIMVVFSRAVTALSAITSKEAARAA